MQTRVPEELPNKGLAASLAAKNSTRQASGSVMNVEKRSVTVAEPTAQHAAPALPLALLQAKPKRRPISPSSQATITQPT